MDFNFLAKTELFEGICSDEIESMMKCLQAKKRNYEKGEYIFRVGDCIKNMGIVIFGSVNIEKDEIWGGHSIISNVSRGQAFGEAYACVFGEQLNINAVAAEKAEVLFFNIEHILTTCSTCCEFHNRLIKNLLKVMALKNLSLTKKMTVISPKSIRERLVSYLSFQAIESNSSDFTIPFNRQQLADYICVDRSAMSKELSKMQKEGLILYNKNKFHINKFD